MNEIEAHALGVEKRRVCYMIFKSIIDYQGRFLLYGSENLMHSYSAIKILGYF